MKHYKSVQKTGIILNYQRENNQGKPLAKKINVFDILTI